MFLRALVMEEPLNLFFPLQYTKYNKENMQRRMNQGWFSTNFGFTTFTTDATYMTIYP